MYSNAWELHGHPSDIEAILSHVGQIPPPLFKAPHPQRNKTTPFLPLLKRSVATDITSSPIISSSICITNGHKYRICIVDESGNLSVCIVDFHHLSLSPRSPSGSKNLAPPPTFQRRMSNDSIFLAPMMINKSAIDLSVRAIKKFGQVYDAKSSKITAVYSSHNDQFLIIGNQDKDRDSLFKVRIITATCEAFLRLSSDITVVQAGGDWVAVSNSDAVISLYEAPNFGHPRFVIPSLTSSVRCCAINPAFHLALIGTRDNTAIAFSLTTGSVSRVIELAGRPSHIMITPAWGFILVHTTQFIAGAQHHNISIFTCSGDFIRSIEVGRPITCWSAVRSPAGFDYVAMADQGGDIYVFEAFYLAIGRRSFSVGMNVCSLHYEFEDDILVAVTEAGRAIFVRLSIK
jgi:hypothetical protein